MTTDLYKAVNFTIGQEVRAVDLANISQFLSAKLTDQVLGRLIGGPTNRDPEFVSQQGADPSTSWAYALRVGGANPRQGSSNNKVKIGAGTLLQKIGNSNGNDSTLLSFTFDGSMEFTLANGDATHPRVDLIQMKLEIIESDSQARVTESAGVFASASVNMKELIQATVSVKAGVAAVSPVYPTPDAGYVPIAAIVVGQTYAGANPLLYTDSVVSGGDAVLHDLRMPIVINQHLVTDKDAGVPAIPRQVMISSLMCTDAPSGVSTPPAVAGQMTTHTRDQGGVILIGSAVPIYYPVTSLEPGDVVTNVFIEFIKGTSNAHTVLADLVYDIAIGTDVASAAPGSNSDNAPGSTPFSFSPGVTILAGRQYYVKITPSGSVAPGFDSVYGVMIKFKRLGLLTDGSTGLQRFICPNPSGRLISVAICAENGSTSANTTRIATDIAGVAPKYMADVSLAMTTVQATRKQYRMTDIEGHALFTAGPVVQGNGTHAPPIWTNGKRCCDESFSIGGPAWAPGAGSEEAYRLSVVYAAPNPNVYDTTFYVAEGL